MTNNLYFPFTRKSGITPTDKGNNTPNTIYGGNSVNNKKTNNKQDLKHLEDAIFSTPAASANDCTGFVNTIPENNNQADALSSLLQVPTSPRKNNK